MIDKNRIKTDLVTRILMTGRHQQQACYIALMLSKSLLRGFLLENKMIYKTKDLCSPCVYLLKKDGVVVYVGSSRVGITRALSHFDTKDYDEVELMPCDLSLITSLETEKIIEHNPIYNVGFPPSTTYMSILQIQRRIRAVRDERFHHKPIIYKKMRAKGIKPVHQDIYRVEDVKFLWEELA